MNSNELANWYCDRVNLLKLELFGSASYLKLLVLGYSIVTQ